MKYSTFILLFLLAIQVSGQTSLVQGKARIKVFGKDLRNDSEIKGIEYPFEDYVHEIYADSVSGLVTLKILNAIQNGKWMTDNGSVAVFDPSTEKLTWSAGVNFERGSADQVGSVIVNSNPYKGRYILDLKDGKTLWETKEGIFYSDPVTLVGFMFGKAKPKESYNTIVGIDFTSGKTLWSRAFNRDDVWNETVKITDSEVALVTSGIHTYNLRTGSGWDYDFTPGKGRARSAVSNLVHDQSKFYIATADKLICLDQSGKLIWSTPLPVESMSKSHLMVRKGTLYLVNRGLINPGPEQYLYGKPFFAAYELGNGHEKFLTPISGKDFVDGLELQGTSISLIMGSSNRIVKYALKDGSQMTAVSFNEKEVGRLRYFAGDLRFPAGQKLFIRSSASDFQNLIQSDTTKEFVVTTQQKAIILNDQLKMVGEIPYKDMFMHSNSLGRLKLLSNAEQVYETYIVDQRNKAIGKVEASYSAMFLGTTLFDSNEKNFVEIDLGGFK